jgi:ectoine hydroxylase-related dioxygenase (phytanoyl-CoA dioxygenase family)
MMTGKGYLILPQLFSPDDIREAREIILHHSDSEDQKITHFHGAHEDKVNLQRRVWNLLNKGDVFVKMVQHPTLIEIVGAFLGGEFCLGSIAANRILPGGPGQEPHVDYPYWDLHKRQSFPTNINASFPLNCQATVLLDDFTEENGATAVLPGSQGDCVYPDEDGEKRFYRDAERMTGKAGDVALFYGLTWHCAMPNHSDSDRTGILIQYLPKFVKPMEDQQRGVRADVIKEATPILKQLLGFDYPYPQILDEAEAKNEIGRHSEEGK